MSISDKYRKLQLDNKMLKQMLSFVCEQIELGSNANFDCPQAQQLFAWWHVNKPEKKDK